MPSSPRRARRRRRTPRLALAVAATVVLTSAAAAQTPRPVPTPVRPPTIDSTRLLRGDQQGHRLGPVVVTADRAERRIETSTAAVTRLDVEALRRLPTQTVAGALELVAGIAVLHSDALGDAPRLAVRGFYGGGETEYVTVLLDGVPLTGLATGQVNWDLVPLAALEAIEVVRGGASAAYGDAAVGGVVNLITRRGDAAWNTWRLAAGELGTVRGGGAAGGRLAGRTASAFGDVRRTDGYRAHENRTSGTLGGSLALVERERGRLALSTLHHRRELDEPGPLTGAELAASRRLASPFFRFDETRERLHRLTLDGTAAAGRGRRVTGYLTGEHARIDALRTVPLAAEFADAKARELSTDRLFGSVQLEASGVLAGVANRLVLGTDVTVGRLATAYRGVVTGDSATFAQSTGEPGDVEARGRGRRTGAAAFASWEALPTAAVRVTLGGRVDRIADHFEPRAPSEGETYRSTHVAFSPRAGVNVRYLDGARQTGHVYLSAGRSFKAATIDQLFDQRSVPVPFDPFQITTSNPELDPQFGTSVEAGAYHRVGVLDDRAQALLSASVYQMDMRNELDFDLQQFRYVNLGRSRHRGVEAGLTLAGPAAMSAFANVTVQEATSRFGENDGRRLKAVPHDVYALGVAREPAHGLGLAATASTVRGIFLDDANERRLDPYTRLDLRASYPVRDLRLAVNVRNLIGTRYSTTGFPDPGGSDVMFYYPAAGRVVTVELSSIR